MHYVVYYTEGKLKVPSDGKERFRNKTSLKILFRTMISHKDYSEVQKKFFCIKNILIPPIQLQKPKTGPQNTATVLLFKF